MFDDLLAANRRYAAEAGGRRLQGEALAGLGVLTCIDSRIDPLPMLGLQVGDAKIIRNAGARVTPDVLRSLVIATNLLGVARVAVVQHTECALTGSTETELRDRISALRRVDAEGWQFLSMPDQLAALRADIEAIKNCPLIPDNLVVGGFVLDIGTGRLSPIDPGSG